MVATPASRLLTDTAGIRANVSSSQDTHEQNQSAEHRLQLLISQLASRFRCLPTSPHPYFNTQAVFINGRGQNAVAFQYMILKICVTLESATFVKAISMWNRSWQRGRLVSTDFVKIVFRQ